MCDVERNDIIVRPHVVYGLRVETFGDNVAYIGQTHQALQVRAAQHADAQYWGDLITDVVEIFTGEMTCIEARKIEGTLTEVLGTALNRPIPQVGTESEIRPVWNPAAESAESLRDGRRARDTEQGRPIFTHPRDRVSGS